MLVKFPQGRGGCCFGPLDSRSGSRQFLIGEIDQIHKMDRVSKVTLSGSLGKGASTKRQGFHRCATLSPPIRACTKAWCSSAIGRRAGIKPRRPQSSQHSQQFCAPRQWRKPCGPGSTRRHPKNSPDQRGCFRVTSILPALATRSIKATDLLHRRLEAASSWRKPPL